MTTQNPAMQIQIITTPEGIQAACDEAIAKAMAKFNDNSVTKKPVPLLSRKEAADYLNLSIGTLGTLTTTEQLPCVQIGRGVKYSIEDLDNFINNRK